MTRKVSFKSGAQQPDLDDEQDNEQEALGSANVSVLPQCRYQGGNHPAERRGWRILPFAQTLGHWQRLFGPM